MATPVTADTLRAVAPRFTGAPARAQADIIGAIADEFTSILAEYDIDTDLRVAHFLAQIVHESAGLRTTREFDDGTHFAKYEGRVKNLGNTQKGDGARFCGRGLLQLTGRANYRRYGQKLGLDLEGHPEQAAEPVTSLRIACVYWQDRHINAHCDADDVVAVTRLVNGGTNGLADRRQYLAKAKQALAQASAAPVVASVEADDSAPSPHAAREPEAEAAHGTDARRQAPAEEKPGVFSSMSFTKVNELADHGSRIAGWIRSIKRWFWGGAAATGGGASALMNSNSGTKHGFIGIIEAHPFLFVGIVLGLAAVVVYVAVRLIERHLVTAAMDGRYRPRGAAEKV